MSTSETGCGGGGGGGGLYPEKLEEEMKAAGKAELYARNSATIVICVFHQDHGFYFVLISFGKSLVLFLDHKNNVNSLKN